MGLSAGARKPVPLSPSDFYIGEGWAEVGADAGQAREQAKARALGDLARNVRVTVRTALIDVLGQSAGQTRQSLESRIDAYADIPPTRLDREEFIFNQPRRGQLACRVGVNRARFDADVRRDLLAKKKRALDDAERARSALKDGRLADALAALQSLQTRAAADFPGLPLDGDANADGKTVDVLRWAQIRRDELLESLKLACPPGPFIYGEDGRFPEPFAVRAAWSGPRPAALDGLPLRAVWTHRPDHAVERAVTDKEGIALLHPPVDVFVESAVLKITLDDEEGGPSAACRSDFHRRRQAAVTVTADREDVRGPLSDEVLSRLKRLPWDVRTGDEGAERGRDSRIRLSARTRVVRHPDGEIHRAEVVIDADIYSGPAGKTVFHGEGPSAAAFGGTPTDAVQNAVKALIPKISPWLTEKVKGLP